MKPTIRHRTVAALAALCALLLSVGCESQQEKAMRAQVPLAERASLETMLARYDTMQSEVRAALDAAIGPRTWKLVSEESLSGCHTDIDPDGRGSTRSMANWGFAGGIPDVDWPRAKEAVLRVVNAYGFTTQTLTVERPGYHKITGYDLSLGAFYDWGSNVDSSFMVTTGCHIPTNPRGTPFRSRFAPPSSGSVPSPGPR